MPSNETFIIAAYVLTWATLLAYLVYVVRRTHRARSELTRMPGAPEGAPAGGRRS